MDVNAVLMLMVCVLIGGLLCLSAVALGGYLVFKTKKESYETLWSHGKEPEGFVSVLGEEQPVDNVVSNLSDADKIVEKSKNKFVDQLAAEILAKETGK